MSTSDILESLIEKDNGYLITAKAVESGVSKPSVSKYVREHDMEKVAHGIYILDNVWPDELFVLQQRNKNIIYSGETALYLHGLTHIKKKNKEVRYANPEILDMGTCEIPSSSGNLVKVYDKERCICDLIKDRKKYEIQLYQTAIKEYMSSKEKNLSRLIEYAVKLGVRDEVMMYVEVMV